MNFADCLHSLCGVGIRLINRHGRLVIRSASYTPDAAQAACLKAHRPFLLAILPPHTETTPGALLEALEAYQEREAIMMESGVQVYQRQR